MRKHSTFEFSSSLEALNITLTGKSIPDELLKPLNAIASVILSQMGSGRKSFCLTSSENNKEVRDLFGNVLARVLTSHNASTVLVDCDFTNTGLSGVVLRKDALGFLDMLLYGSSFSSVVQERESGTKVIGAGSFPVNKRMPFALEPFESTIGYLQSKSDCAIYCCPVEDDEDHIHPIVSSLGYAIVIGTSGRMGPINSLEERLESEESIEFITVSIVLRGEEEIVVEEALKEVEMPLLDKDKIPAEKEMTATSISLKKDEGEVKSEDEFTQKIDEETLIRKSGSSFIPKLLTAVIGVALIAFLVWWMIITKPMRENQGIMEESKKPPIVMADTTDEKKAHEDSAKIQVASSDSSRESASKEVGVVALEEGAGAEEPAKMRPDTSKGLQLEKAPERLKPTLEKLDSFSGKYLIHISSFKKIENANRDAGYLLRKGFPIFVARVNLRVKGVWFRVYSGPYDIRSKALEAKIKLDELSRVKFTRLTKIN